jgi:hypothetical protein
VHRLIGGENPGSRLRQRSLAHPTRAVEAESDLVVRFRERVAHDDRERIGGRAECVRFRFGNAVEVGDARVANEAPPRFLGIPGRRDLARHEEADRPGRARELDRALQERHGEIRQVSESPLAAGSPP